MRTCEGRRAAERADTPIGSAAVHDRRRPATRAMTWSFFSSRSAALTHAVVPPVSSCTNATGPDAALSYAAPRHFPFPPFRQILETAHGRCDLAGGAPNCAKFSRGELMMPEPFVVQAIASVLGHCPYASRRCYAIDVGGNLGIHSAYMASLGARVDVVEAAVDLAGVAERTAHLNCWGARVRVLNRAISVAADGKKFYFQGGWRLDDRGATHRRKHEVTQLDLPKLISGRRVDLIKIDIDNARMETALIAAVARMASVGATDVRAIVIEAQTAGARQGARGPLAPLAEALSQMQRSLGYYIYRLAHHLHSVDDPEPWYSPCIGARAIKFMLYVRPLSPGGWLQLLALRRDAARGRADGTSFLISRDPMGRGAEARWGSESMEWTMPDRWRGARCGANASSNYRAARPPPPRTVHSPPPPPHSASPN